MLYVTCLQAHLWWAAAGSGLRAALVALLDDLPPDMPVLLLATAELSGPAAASAPQQQQRWRLRLPVPPSSGGSSSMYQQLAGHHQQQQQQHCDLLDQLGLDPALAALFPNHGNISEAQQQRQQQQQQVLGCGVLGWVLLGPVAAAERQQMFKVGSSSSAQMRQ